MSEERRMTEEEIQRLGTAALVKELGVSGMIRFLGYYSSGYGDYTAERERWQKDITIEDIARGIYQEREREGG